MLLSVDHLRTFRDINRLNTYNTPLKRKSLILSLGYTGSSLADDEIRQNFLQPLSQERGEIIKTLFEKKRPRLIPELIKEAENPISFNRQEAIFALGAYRQPEVKDLLLRLIHDEDDLTASNAAKSLARIGYKKHFSYSYERFAADSTRGLLSRDLNYVIAFYNINPQGEWLESLFSKETIGRGEIYTQNFTTLVVRLMGLSPSLGWIYQKNNDSPGEGMSILLDETREIELFFTNQDWLFRSFTEGKYGLIWEWCHSILENVEPKGAAVPILKSIMSCERESAAGSDALAVIFFSYHILKNGGNL